MLCRRRHKLHFLRNVLAQVPKGSSEMVAAAIRTIFAQPDAEHVREQLGVIAGMLGGQSVKVETMLRDTAEDLLAFTSFPAAHWKKIWSTDEIVNPLLGHGLLWDPFFCSVAAQAGVAGPQPGSGWSA